MTDHHAEPEAAMPDPAGERARIGPEAQAHRTDLLPGLYLLGLVVLAVAVYFLWTNSPDRKLAPEEASKVNTLDSRLAKLEQQVSTLQSRPPAPTQSAFDKLDQQVQDLANKPPPSLAPIEQRLSNLESKQAATPDQVSQLSAQVIQLANKIPDVQPLSQRVDTLDSNVRQLGTQVQSLSTKLDDAGKAITQAEKEASGQNEALKQAVAGLHSELQQTQNTVQGLPGQIDAAKGAAQQQEQQLSQRMDALEQQSKQTVEQVQKVAQKAQLATMLQGAAAKLAAGQKLGSIPGAPPALAKYADTAPPTEASLRASFDQYAARAVQASHPQASSGASFGSRMWARAQEAVTVRQGDHVLVGDPVSGTLQQARDELDNGDLQGAVKTLKGLPEDAQKPMQPWIEQAQSLLDARSAIATMAAG